jgi:hypothetical protein
VRRGGSVIPTLLNVIAGMALSVAVVGFTHGGRDVWLACVLVVAGLLLAYVAGRVSARAAALDLESAIQEAVGTMSDQMKAALDAVVADRQKPWWQHVLRP